MAELTGETLKQQVQLEKDNLDSSYEHTLRLLNAELEKGTDKSKPANTYITIHEKTASRLAARVILPVKEFPQVNFTGRLLGPGGQNLKAMQEQTGCKMSIMGRGSMRDKVKEEELRQQGGKYAHLNDELHVLVECFGYPLPEAYTYLGYALAEVRKYLHPEFDQNDAYVALPQAANGSTHRGMPRGRGLLPTRGRGGPPAARGVPGVPPRGARGGPPARGARGSMRGRGGFPGGVPAPPAAAAYAQASDPYAGYASVEAEQEDPYAVAAATGYEDPNAQYAGYEAYDASDPSQTYQQAAADPNQYYADYSQYTADASYDAWGTAASAYGKTPSPAAARGARGGHPYAHARGARGARR